MSSDRDARARVALDVGLGQDPEPATPRADTPFNIAVLGEFCGGSSGGALDFQPVLVDRDTIDDVIAQFSPQLRFRVTLGDPSAGQSEFSVRFGALDDFHPDRLLQRVPPLAALWQLRQRLADPRTFAEAARALRGADEGTERPPVRASGASLLEDILAGQPGPALTPAGGAREDDLQVLIQRVVAPHLIANPDPRQTALVAQVDEALVKGMRALMHRPEFQSLESLWRGIDFLTRRLETSSMLRVHVVHVPRFALATDGLVRVLDARVGGAPWGVLAGCYTFGASAQDATLLADVARLARAAGVPFVAGADIRLAGCPTLHAFTDPAGWNEPVDAAWDVLRRSGDARHVALALPRFLLRAPYGEDGEPCDLLPFEETTDVPAHADFLWGSPAIACALSLGQSFERAGWQLRPGTVLDIDGLPLHLLRSAGSADVLPCAESLMTDRAAARLVAQGLTPLATLKDQGALRLVRVQSMAQPTAPLAGGWDLQRP
jgi:type VI secretion system protein ImpC